MMQSSSGDISVSFRRAVSADLERIVSLIAGGQPTGVSREISTSPPSQNYIDAFAAIEANKNNFLVVVELESQIVGTMQLTTLQYLSHVGGSVLQIESIHVASNTRSQGIGAKMMDFALEVGRKEGCHRMQLTTDKRRPDAHRFYERMGFQATHEGMKRVVDPVESSA